MPGAKSEIASSLSLLESVSMSNESTRGSADTSAGRTTGLSNTRAIPPTGAAASPSTPRRAALDLATIALVDAALDQIADGEAHVGFEGFDAAVMQAVT